MAHTIVDVSSNEGKMTSPLQANVYFVRSCVQASIFSHLWRQSREQLRHPLWTPFSFMFSSDFDIWRGVLESANALRFKYPIENEPPFWMSQNDRWIEKFCWKEKYFESRVFCGILDWLVDWFLVFIIISSTHKESQMGMGIILTI